MDSNLTIEENLQRGPAPTVMVTGGAGFIGSHLVGALISRGHRVRVIDNRSTGESERVHRTAEFMAADISQPGSLEYLFDGIDWGFHTAALPHVPRQSIFQHVRPAHGDSESVRHRHQRLSAPTNSRSATLWLMSNMPMSSTECENPPTCVIELGWAHDFLADNLSYLH